MSKSKRAKAKANKKRKSLQNRRDKKAEIAGCYFIPMGAEKEHRDRPVIWTVDFIPEANPEAGNGQCIQTYAFSRKSMCLDFLDGVPLGFAARPYRITRNQMFHAVDQIYSEQGVDVLIANNQSMALSEVGAYFMDEVEEEPSWLQAWEEEGVQGLKTKAFEQLIGMELLKPSLHQ